MSAVIENLNEMAAVVSNAVDLPPDNSTLPLRNERPTVQLPRPGLEVSSFAQEVGELLDSKNVWFVKADRVVEVREKALSSTVRTLVFHPLTASETRTAVEQHLQTGNLINNEGATTFVARTMNCETAAALLDSVQLKGQLPCIERIVTVPVPLLQEGQLVYVNRGYDSRFNTYCPVDAPEINPLPLCEAKEIIQELLTDFCFKNEPSVTMAIARLLTPLCRGIMGWDAKPPVWLYEANRPRAGKDYLATCALVLYEGHANEDSPLDTEGEETRKRLMAALLAGRRFMHFSNCKGHIDNPVFEQAATSKVFSARQLGRNDAASDLSVANEIEFSLSANIGFSFTEDFELRCRKITLHYPDEDANSRSFTHQDLHCWIRHNRSRILGALAGLIHHWDQAGRPDGTTPFTSFPEWARVVGGIMVSCDLGDPCAKQADDSLTGDPTTNDMKELFRIANTIHNEKWIGKDQVKTIVRHTDESGQTMCELFPWLDLDERSGQVSFGTTLTKFDGRVLGGIQLIIDKKDKRRPRYQFTTKIEQAVSNPVRLVINPGQAESQTGKCQSRQSCQSLQPRELPDLKPIKDNTPMVHGVIKIDEITKIDIPNPSIPLLGIRTVPMPELGHGTIPKATIPGQNLSRSTHNHPDPVNN